MYILKTQIDDSSPALYEQPMDLKAQAHHLKPIILVGKNGITESLIAEIDAALKAHELMKIKFHKKTETFEWLTDLKAQLIETKGNTITIYRKNPKKKA